MIILTIIIFGALMITAIKLSLRIAWGLAKIIGVVLCVAALPLLVIFLITAGGFILLLPVLLVAAACGVLLFGK